MHQPPNPPPPGYVPPPGQQPQYAYQPEVPTHLVWAILTTLFCCLPFGVVSIVYASQVKTLASTGAIDAAREASRKARLWAMISAGAGVVVLGIYLLAFVAGMVMEANGY